MLTELALAVVLAVHTGPATGPERCADAATPAELQRCLQRELAQADSLLKAAETRFARALPTDAARAQFGVAGRAWRNYREHECRAQAARHEGAPTGARTYGTCRIALSEARLRLLDEGVTPAAPASDSTATPAS